MKIINANIQRRLYVVFALIFILFLITLPITALGLGLTPDSSGPTSSDGTESTSGGSGSISGGTETPPDPTPSTPYNPGGNSDASITSNDQVTDVKTEKNESSSGVEIVSTKEISSINSEFCNMIRTFSF